MGETTKKILSIYKLPGLVVALISIPGVNNLLWFNPHGLPFIGLLLVYCVPLCTPYVLFCLVRVMKPTRISLSIQESHRNQPRHKVPQDYKKYGCLSFLAYLVLLYPLSAGAVASFNWGRTEMKWKTPILYKCVTFPLGFALPPYKVNRETVDVMITVLQDTL